MLPRPMSAPPSTRTLPISSTAVPFTEEGHYLKLLGPNWIERVRDTCTRWRYAISPSEGSDNNNDNDINLIPFIFIFGPDGNVYSTAREVRRYLSLASSSIMAGSGGCGGGGKSCKCVGKSIWIAKLLRNDDQHTEDMFWLEGIVEACESPNCQVNFSGNVELVNLSISRARWTLQPIVNPTIRDMPQCKNFWQALNVVRLAVSRVALAVSRLPSSPQTFNNFQLFAFSCLQFADVSLTDLIRITSDEVKLESRIDMTTRVLTDFYLVVSPVPVPRSFVIPGSYAAYFAPVWMHESQLHKSEVRFIREESCLNFWEMVQELRLPASCGGLDETDEMWRFYNVLDQVIWISERLEVLSGGECLFPDGVCV